MDSDNVYQTRMNMNNDDLEQVGVQTSPLYFILLKFIGELPPFLKSAPHQRKERWSPQKQDILIEDVRNKTLGPCMFCTYQLRPPYEPTLYINDGLQRLLALTKYYNNPERFGDTKEAATKNLQCIKVSVDHRIYDNPEQAVDHFIKLQYGTPATAYEILSGLLTYTPGYETFWCHFIDDLCEACDKSALLITKRLRKLDEPAQHKIKRDNYSLFLRFIENDKRARNSPDSFSNKNIDVARVKKDQTLEYRLRTWMLTTDRDTAKKKLKEFETMMLYNAGKIEEIWSKYRTPQAETPTDTTTRWLLAVLIFAHNNSYPVGRTDGFLDRFFEVWQGATTYQPSDHRRGHLSLGKSKLEVLRPVCETIGSDFWDVDSPKWKRQTQNRSQIPDDKHLSHVKSFAHNGDGLVFAETALTNLARGAQDI